MSLLVCVPVAFAFGMGLFYTLFKDAAANEDKNVSLLLAVGLMYMLDNLMLTAWTANPRFISTSYSSFTIRIGEINISFVRLMALVIALVAATLVYYFLKNTRLGTAVRAASEDMQATTLLGISSSWVMAVAFAIGIGLAGTAGVVMASVYSFDPNYGFTFALKALVALFPRRYRQRLGGSDGRLAPGSHRKPGSVSTSVRAGQTPSRTRCSSWC